MIWEIFVFGGILFWLLFAAELAVVVGCLHFRRGGWATLSLVVFLLALWLFGNVNIFLLVWENPITFVWCTGAYVLIAAGWGFAKWTIYQRENSYRYLELRQKFLKAKKVEGNELPPELKVEWKEWFDRNKHGSDWEGDVEFNPLASEHKATIMGWMIFWPISAIWTLIDDAVIKMFRHLYYMMYNWLESIRKYYWGAYENDMPTDEERQDYYNKQREESRRVEQTQNL